MLKECIEKAFEVDGENRVLRFLLEKELHSCENDADRWVDLFGKCEYWRDKYLIWEENTSIIGVYGWYLNMDVCRLKLPEEDKDWIEYLYRMTLLPIVNQMETDEKNAVVAKGEDNNFSSGEWLADYHIDSGFAELTREQWLEEITDILNKSWEVYQKHQRSNSVYQRVMESNFPKCKKAFEYLVQNIGECEVVRMNQHCLDETVWYFAKAQGCFYLMYLSDNM